MCGCQLLPLFKLLRASDGLNFGAELLAQHLKVLIDQFWREMLILKNGPAAVDLLPHHGLQPSLLVGCQL
jgi:hypothetical protein